MKTSHPLLALRCGALLIIVALAASCHQEPRREVLLSAVARMEGRGEAAFALWAEGARAYPVSLAGKSVLLVGDSMAEGLRPSLQQRVEAAGGRFFGEPWQSST